MFRLYQVKTLTLHNLPRHADWSLAHLHSDSSGPVHNETQPTTQPYARNKNEKTNRFVCLITHTGAIWALVPVRY